MSELESFDDISSEITDAPEVTVTKEDQGYDTSKPEPGLDTFDSPNPEPLKKDSQVNQLDEKEDVHLEEKDKEVEKEEGKEDDKEDEPDSEEKLDSEGEKKEETPKIEGKTIKLFQDGKQFEVPADAIIKTKVDGRWEKVSVSELRDNYSGKVAYDKKFSEIGEKDKALAEKEQTLTKLQENITSRVTSVSSALKEAMENNANPMEAVNKIVDLLGVDSYDFNRALFDSMTEELVTLDNMDEYERKAYWLEKRNDHLQKKHESFEESTKAAKAQEERLAQVDRIREAHGVTEDDFVSAYEKLSQSNENVSPEQVIQYAVNLPLLETAEELLSPYEDQLDDTEFETMMAKIATTMKSNKELTREDIETYLAEVYEVEDIINQANSKAGKLNSNAEENLKRAQVPQSQNSLYENSTYESFSDF